MSSEQQLFVLRSHCFGVQADVLVDNGASHNFVSQQFLDSLRAQTKDIVLASEVQMRLEQLHITLANGYQV